MFHKVQDLIGYSVKATDAHVGHIRDLFVDDSTWSVRFLIIDTNDALAEKEIVLTRDWVRAINPNERTLYLNASLQALRNGTPPAAASVTDEAEEPAIEDAVDEALSETFPASDPPAYS